MHKCKNVFQVWPFCKWFFLSFGRPTTNSFFLNENYGILKIFFVWKMKRFFSKRLSLPKLKIKVSVSGEIFFKPKLKFRFVIWYFCLSQNLNFGYSVWYYKLKLTMPLLNQFQKWNEKKSARNLEKKIVLTSKNLLKLKMNEKEEAFRVNMYLWENVKQNQLARTKFRSRLRQDFDWNLGLGLSYKIILNQNFGSCRFWLHFGSGRSLVHTIWSERIPLQISNFLFCFVAKYLKIFQLICRKRSFAYVYCMQRLKSMQNH